MIKLLGIYLKIRTSRRDLISLFGTCISNLMNLRRSGNKRWFNDMFELHDKWIHAYFNDTRMYGLLKTTSRLESMNSFFNTYSQSGNLLLHFMLNYDTAIQKQRNTQKELDHETKKASKNKSTNVLGIVITNMLEHFNHFGTLCRHAFNIIMKLGIKEMLDNTLRIVGEMIHVHQSKDSKINRFVNQCISHL
uniref:Protein FAR1-RELATED SEQUENCE n=1 Tax=Lactuca sativa TaxID=4236 RepID=A0A9R1XSL3_LACSA|nr:hypothetical protein LSAT_V11C100043940 [Lactuca sativa]